MFAWKSFIYTCTRALHSFRSFAHWRAASTVIPLLPKATFTPSIQPNLCLSRTRLYILPPSTPFWPWHSNYTSQTLHLKNIHFPSLCTSHTPHVCSVQRRWYNYSFIWTLLGLSPQSSIVQRTFQRSPRSMPLIHSVYHIQPELCSLVNKTSGASSSAIVT